MSLEDDVKQALHDAGAQLKNDLWKPGDDTFLAARAKDLAELEAKAATAPPNQKMAFTAAAKDVVNEVKLLAVIRAEAAADHAKEEIGQFFLNKVLPALIRLLPALL